MVGILAKKIFTDTCNKWYQKLSTDGVLLTRDIFNSIPFGAWIQFWVQSAKLWIWITDFNFYTNCYEEKNKTQGEQLNGAVQEWA
jgi:hypothetical protein